jgi:FdhE protein
LDFVTTSALAPSLALAAEQLAKLVPENMPYEHGHCPLCGSQPLISFLRGAEGQRHAVCSLCAHEYRIRRIA